MKDKLEPNMYVRTKWGYICKIININDFREPSMKYGVEASYLKDVMFIGDDDILKASHNIIDLIKVGDYINGSWVNEIVDGKPIHEDYNDPFYSFGWENDDIKTVITHEQIEQMAYKVGE